MKLEKLKSNIEYWVLIGLGLEHKVLEKTTVLADRT